MVVLGVVLVEQRVLKKVAVVEVEVDRELLAVQLPVNPV